MLNRIIKLFCLKVASIHDVENALSSTVYHCQLQNGEIVYIKIPYTKTKFYRELEAYKILKDKVPIPDLLDYWTGDEECPGALLLSKLKGEPLTKTASPNLSYQVGVLQATMHSVQPPEVLTTIDNEFSIWSQFLEDKFYDFAKDVKKVLDPKVYEDSIRLFEKMKQELPEPDGPCFIHMDFRPANIIVDGEKVSGVIDFESVRFGSTEIDFTKLYRDFLRFDDVKFTAFQEGYNSVRPLIDLDTVLPFYRFTDAFNSIGWCYRRGLEKHAKFYQENLQTLKSFLQ